MFLVFSNNKLICFNPSVCYLFFSIANIFVACHNCMYPSHVFIYSLLFSLKQKYYVYSCLYFDVLFNNSFHSVTYNLFSQRYTLCFKHAKCKIMANFKIELKQLQRPLYSGNISVQHFCNTEILWTVLSTQSWNIQLDFLPVTKFWYKGMYLVIYLIIIYYSPFPSHIVNKTRC